MNYLAHLFLSDNTPHSMLGNLLGDFVKGNVKGKFPQEVVAGIRNHRRVDTFTDSNTVVSSSKKLISASRARFSGVIVDVAYDYILIQNWGLYSRIALDEFIGTVYKNLSNHGLKIPDRADTIIEKIIREDLLRSYRSMDGIDAAFKRIAKRIKIKNNLEHAVKELEVNHHRLNMHFLEFFPELMTYCKQADHFGAYRHDSHIPYKDS